jgi:hypothetical protein
MLCGYDSPHEVAVNVQEVDETRRNELDGFGCELAGRSWGKQQDRSLFDQTEKAPTTREKRYDSLRSTAVIIAGQFKRTGMLLSVVTYL